MMAIALDPHLPRHRVIERNWRVEMWWVLVPAVLVIVALTAFWWLWQAEKARAERAEAQFLHLAAAESKLSVVFDGEGVICKVPQGQERAAVQVKFQCESLSQTLKMIGAGK